MKLKSLIPEQIFLGKTLMSVDIQPEYETDFTFRTTDFTSFINKHYDSTHKMVFLYNGEETMGSISENDYKIWLTDNGLFDRIVDEAVFYDKGYHFFRRCIDAGIDDDHIVKFIKFMVKNNVHDSRRLTRDMWRKYIRENGSKDIKELLEYSRELIHIPDLMKWLRNYNNIILMGGGFIECLKEVEITLRVLGKRYSIYKPFTY